MKVGLLIGRLWLGLMAGLYLAIAFMFAKVLPSTELPTAARFFVYGLIASAGLFLLTLWKWMDSVQLARPDSFWRFVVGPGPENRALLPAWTWGRRNLAAWLAIIICLAGVAVVSMSQ